MYRKVAGICLVKPTVILPVSGLSTSVSLVSLAWAVASYSNALRLAYREAYYTRWAGLVIQALWHMGVVASRVVAIAVFASVYHAWTFLAVGKDYLNSSNIVYRLLF